VKLAAQMNHFGIVSMKSVLFFNQLTNTHEEQQVCAIFMLLIIYLTWLVWIQYMKLLHQH